MSIISNIYDMHSYETLFKSVEDDENIFTFKNSKINS